MTDILSFYRGKRVLVTGHTGFKGTWLVRTLLNAGAKVTGYSLEPPTNPSLYSLTDTERKSIQSKVMFEMVSILLRFSNLLNRRLFFTLQPNP